MESNKESNNLPGNMDIVVVIDKEKLKILEENLPKDIRDKVLQMLGTVPPPNNKEDKSDKDIPKDNRLFAIQTGTVVGNIYTDGIYNIEEDIHKTKDNNIQDTDIKDNNIQDTDIKDNNIKDTDNKDNNIKDKVV